MKIACPQCGADNRIETVDIFIRCPYCQSTLYIDLDGIRQAVSFKPEIDGSQVGLYLKRDFEKFGFGEALSIRPIGLVFFPFWMEENKPILARASAAFPRLQIPVPASEAVFFDIQTEAAEALIYDVDCQSQPSASGFEGKKLCYVPYYRALVRQRQLPREYPFLVNAISGTVEGERLPLVSVQKIYHLFPVFLLIFLAFLLVNQLLDQFWPALFVNLALTASIFFLQRSWLRKGG